MAIAAVGGSDATIPVEAETPSQGSSTARAESWPGEADPCAPFWGHYFFPFEPTYLEYLATQDDSATAAGFRLALEAWGLDRNGSVQLWRNSCSGALYAQNLNVSAPPVTTDDLIPAAYDRAFARITRPVLNVSPNTELVPGAPPGGLVNFGLWLAVGEQAPASARAEVADVWAQVDVHQVAVTWDMGNSDVVECTGFGDPIPPEAMSSDDPSLSCGSTYRRPSDASGFPLSATAVWQVRVTGSDGRDTLLPDVTLTTTTNYLVAEVQTIGVAPDS